MAESTGISWTDSTWSPVVGCSRVSEGCRNCYSERLVATRLRHTAKYSGLAQMTQAGPRWTNVVRCVEGALLEPLGWRKPRRIFVNSMSDTFHKDVPFEFLDRMFAVMALCPQHTFQVLTKRPERAAEYFADQTTELQVWWRARARARLTWPGRPEPGSDHGRSHLLPGMAPTTTLYASEVWPLPNVWIGTSCEHQAAADERIPHLLNIPAAVRFLSCEPLLGPLRLPLARVRLKTFVHSDLPLGMGPMKVVEAGEHYATTNRYGALSIDTPDGPLGIRPDEFERLPNEIHWVIGGGESGPNARPMYPDWARSLRDQCAGAGVPFHFKQWGEWCPANQGPNAGPMGHFDIVTEVAERLGVKAAGRLLDGVEHLAFPEVRS